MIFMCAKSGGTGVNEVSVRRENGTQIRISTLKALTDDQMEDLYWCVYAMHESGKTLRELLKNDVVKKAKVDIEGSHLSWWYVCEECHGQIPSGTKVCPYCKSELDWSDIYPNLTMAKKA